MSAAEAVRDNASAKVHEGSIEALGFVASAQKDAARRRELRAGISTLAKATSLMRGTTVARCESFVRELAHSLGLHFYGIEGRCRGKTSVLASHCVFCSIRTDLDEHREHVRLGFMFLCH